MCDEHQYLNSTNLIDEKKLSIYEQLSKVAKQQPDAIAIVSSGGKLTYKELIAYIDKVACQLIEIGFSEGDKAILLVQRNIFYPIGFLALLKIGAVIIPMDPNYPVKRFSQLVEKTEIKFVVCDQAIQKHTLLNSIQHVNTANSIASSTDERSLGHTNFVAKNLHNAGYIMFTSGSTGNPKSIFISQLNIVNYLYSLGLRIQLNKSDIYLHFASISFSSSVRQLLLPLLNGCCALISSDSEKKDFNLFAEMLLKHHVSVIDCTPSHLDAFLSVIAASKKLIRIKNEHFIKKILVASEPLLKATVEKSKQVLGTQLQLINMYGQTETTGIVSTYSISGSELSLAEVVPLGKPLKNIDIKIFDELLNPLPNGQIGEICISGPTLYGEDHKYVNEDANFFFFTANGKKIRYIKTGDLGKKLDDGNIQFISRKGFLVKIRGIRVDLQEIKNILVQHEDIKNAFVVPLLHKNETVIGAYIISSNHDCNPKNIRKFLMEESLPDYMVPQVFKVSQNIPMSENFKINYQLISSELSLELIEKNTSDRFFDLVDPLQSTIFEIWATAFGKNIVSVNASFFELGGQSLLAAKIAAMVNDQLSVDINMIDIFNHDTIEKMVIFLREKLSDRSSLITV